MDASWIVQPSIPQKYDDVLFLRVMGRLVSHYRTAFILVALFGAIVLTSPGQEQPGSIHGMVTDPSGAVIPGVTVTLSSPALITPQTATTDASGLYHFELLPVGIYRTTFSQTGFKQLVRENIVIVAGFSAELNVKLSLGSTAETVTVSAAGPVVDTTSTTVSTNLSSVALTDQLPVTRELSEVVAVTPGVVPSSAPNLGGGVLGDFGVTAYGLSAQQTPMIEGILTRQSSDSTGGNWDVTAFEDFRVIAVGGDAEISIPGINFSAVVKSGGDQFHGRAELNAEDQALEANNLTPFLRSQGNTTPALILWTIDPTVQLGGPFIKNRWWFFGSGHLNANSRNAVGYEVNGQPGSEFSRETNGTVKTTYQLSPNYKLIGFFDNYSDYLPNRFGSNLVPEVSTSDYQWEIYEAKGEIQGTLRPNLLFDFFWGQHYYKVNYFSQADPLNIPTQLDLSTGASNGPSLRLDRRPRMSHQITGSLSYLPAGSYLGHHDFKVGSTWMYQYTGTSEGTGIHGNYQLIFNNGNPVQIRTYNFPTTNHTNLNEGGFYGEDTWTVEKHITINLGLRLDRFATWYPTQSKPAGPFGPPWSITTPGVVAYNNPGITATYPYTSTGTWTNLAPRVGVSWNVFGDGRTVLKASYGRYNWSPGDDFANAYVLNAPLYTAFTWNGPCPTPGSATGCDYQGNVNLNPSGPSFLDTGNGDLNSSEQPNTSLTPQTIKEQYTSEYQLMLEHELAPNLSVRMGYTYIANANSWLQIDTNIPYSAWNIPYIVHDGGPTANTCLPSATKTCPTTGTAYTIYDVSPAYHGAAFSGLVYANRPSSAADHFGTYEATVTRRSGSGKYSVLASFTAVKDHSWINGNNSYNAQAPIATTPNQLFYPLDTSWNWQAHMTGNYRLPIKFDVSGELQILSGLQGQRTLTYSLPNSGTVIIPVEPFGSEEGPLRPLVSIRVARNFITEHAGTFRPSVEFLNLTNSASPWAITWTSGASFNKYSTVDTPFILRFGLVWSF